MLLLLPSTVPSFSLFFVCVHFQDLAMNQLAQLDSVLHKQGIARKPSGCHAFQNEDIRFPLTQDAFCSLGVFDPELEHQ